jgi:hypothetical protein
VAGHIAGHQREYLPFGAACSFSNRIAKATQNTLICAANVASSQAL